MSSRGSRRAVALAPVCKNAGKSIQELFLGVQSVDVVTNDINGCTSRDVFRGCDNAQFVHCCVAVVKSWHVLRVHDDVGALLWG